jgi:uroporphyrinogen III methyltransferase/synthase
MGAKRGKVYLVGAGPGDPQLITLKGIEALSKAQVVIYDYLASQGLLKYVSAEAELIYAGKQGKKHTLSQEQIIDLIISKAQSGKTVARLKGGDPFVFGRGGEEGERIVEAGIELEIVPGITSAVAVPAYAGIPLTHRNYTSTVAIITGHEDPTKPTSQIQWDKIATGIGTLVFLMGVDNIHNIVYSLIGHGRNPDTPAAVIRWGTTNEQRTIVGKLADIVQKVRKENLRPPAILIVGEVVQIREKLNWFEKKPLFGKKILVTRAREQASDFAQILEDYGAQVIQFPTIEIHPPTDWSGIDQAIAELENYHWVIFTSANGVNYFWQRLVSSGKDARAFKEIKIAAIGPPTARELQKHGIYPDLVPNEYKAEGIVQSLAKEDLKGVRFLIPRAAKAREILPEKLRELGAEVRIIEAYRTLKPTDNLNEILDLLKAREIDFITFTSSSTVRNLVEILPRDQLIGLLRGIKIASIGPITANTAKEYGINTDIMPPKYTIAALAEAIVQYSCQDMSS